MVNAEQYKCIKWKMILVSKNVKSPYQHFSATAQTIGRIRIFDEV